jgi:hypothetical protein
LIWKWIQQYKPKKIIFSKEKENIGIIIDEKKEKVVNYISSEIGLVFCFSLAIIIRR